MAGPARGARSRRGRDRRHRHEADAEHGNERGERDAPGSGHARSQRRDASDGVCARTLGLVTSTAPPELPKRPDIPKGTANDGSPHRRGYLVAAVVVVVLALAAVLVAANSDPSKITPKVDVAHLPVKGLAPTFEAKTWINSPPLTAADLKGKVVLYDFWTYSCINCQRTFPYIRAWFDRYSADGLVIIGIHSPEFDFEKVTKNVEAAVKRDDVTWPVALDSDMAIWNKFQNNSWPADYIADQTGHIRYTSVGEGEYDTAENVIRELLGVKASSPRADYKVTQADATSTQNSNPETYLGLAVPGPHRAAGRDPQRRARLPAGPAQLGGGAGARARRFDLARARKARRRARGQVDRRQRSGHR